MTTAFFYSLYSTKHGFMDSIYGRSLVAISECVFAVFIAQETTLKTEHTLLVTHKPKCELKRHQMKVKEKKRKRYLGH